MTAHPYAYSTKKNNRSDRQKASRQRFPLKAFLGKIFLVFMVVSVFSLSIGPVEPANALSSLNIALKTPFATLEQSNSCAAGPISMYVQIDVENPTAAAITNLTANFDSMLGMVVETEILLSEDRAGIVIPGSGLIDDAGVSVVYVQVDGESFARRPVDLLERQADRVLVDGLRPWERVVTLGGGTIRRHALMATGPVEEHVH